MAAKKCGAPPAAESAARRPDCVAAVRSHTRAPNQLYAERIARRQRVLSITAWLSVMVNGSFVVVQLLAATGVWQILLINFVTATIFMTVPLLHRFGELVAPLTFISAAYVSIFTIGWTAGTGAGAQLFFLVGACLVVLLVGVEHIALAAGLAGVAAGLVIALEFLVPRDTGLQPPGVVSASFVLTTVSACVIVVATVWYALRDTARAEAAMEAEHERSEALLANMLPASVAERLKDPDHPIIADKYDDASVLFADIVGFTERASSTTPADLVRLLDRLYSAFDELVDSHGLEKIKVSGDSYMVVSGVPRPRPDHVENLADFALDMVGAAAELKDPHGRSVPLRVGLAAGPVVAGVVGSRRFFYDVWGDAVNVASRMESTDSVGQIQVPDDVYERLKDDFVLRERGHINVKGKGVMRTWYLLGRKAADDSETPAAAQPHTARV
ncbi:adenylate/guanylate cyclase domain-containing protein [Mycobacterium spongiae]|uniref:Adenylate cyclase n=1 Tax=Mycobacterium spongiae TaxID=886343 RepID=A0A975PWN7_9MYCO|nr:adenylate/guanylate cyclase domain-containing protein [Mycobacterium spongiae]QUR67406.1 adenylate/guanylate cyclase domain-containing protein [Mycobacterium spongiae]